MKKSIENSENSEDNTMCNICLQSPCDSRCPCADPPKSVFVCSGCGQTIYEGDDYWEFFGEQFCEECIDKARKTAEYVPEEPDDEDERWLRRVTY